MRTAANNENIQMVLLDLDNTIYDFQKTSEEARKRLAAYVARVGNLPVQLVLEVYTQIADETHATIFESGFSMRCHRLSVLARRLNTKFPIEAAAQYFDKQIIEATQAYPGAVHAVRTLREHFQIMILTEGYSDIQLSAATQLGLHQYDLFATFQHRTRKTDGSAYRAIITNYKLDASRVVMIGDNWRNDIIAPAMCGIGTIWISHGRAVQSSIPKRFLGTSSSLPGVPPLLGL